MRPNPATSMRGFSSLGVSEVGEGAIATSDHVMTPEPTMLGCG